jgi:transcriptional regulator with XRE-family HTH domain
MVAGMQRMARGHSRTQAIDRHIGARMRERRIMLGLTQHQMAELIGVSYQQAHKYEKGVNRIPAGRLYQIAQALGIEISYFFKDVERERRAEASELMPPQRMLLELARNFAAIPSPELREALAVLARALAVVDRHDGDSH